MSGRLGDRERFERAPCGRRVRYVPNAIRDYRRLATRRTDHRPASSNTVPMNAAVWLDTAGAGLSSAHRPPLQSALLHWRLSLHGSVSGRLCGVGVTVGVAVLVGVAVGVLVTVGVGVKVTQVPNSQTPEPQGRPETGKQNAIIPIPLQASHTPQGGMQVPPMEPALARVPANTSTTSTLSAVRVMATFTTRKIGVNQKGGVRGRWGAR